MMRDAWCSSSDIGAVVHQRLRIQVGVPAARDRDVAEVLAGRAVLVHVALRGLRVQLRGTDVPYGRSNSATDAMRRRRSSAERTSRVPEIRCSEYPRRPARSSTQVATPASIARQAVRIDDDDAGPAGTHVGAEGEVGETEVHHQFLGETPGDVVRHDAVDVLRREPGVVQGAQRRLEMELDGRLVRAARVRGVADTDDRTAVPGASAHESPSARQQRRAGRVLGPVLGRHLDVDVDEVVVLLLELPDDGPSMIMSSPAQMFSRIASLSCARRSGPPHSVTNRDRMPWLNGVLRNMSRADLLLRVVAIAVVRREAGLPTPGRCSG